jgi:RluA family pseudouridine synthase
MEKEPKSFQKEWILYRDEDFLVMNKPSGLPTHPTVDAQRANLYGLALDFLKRERGPDAYLGIHHRLDRDTSGCILFTLNQKVNPAVARLFEEREIQKIYLARTHFSLLGGKNQKGMSWTVKNYLGKVGKKTKKALHGAVRSGGGFAHSEFEVQEKLKGSLLVRAKIHTGRTHQIRVHLSEDEMPILGDELYGRRCCEASSLKNRCASRLMLHAAELSFPHPVTGKRILIQSPIPEDFKQKKSPSQ